MKDEKPSTTKPTRTLKKEDSRSIASSFKSTPTTLQKEDSKTFTPSFKKDTSRESTPKLKRDAFDLVKAFAESGRNTNKSKPTQQESDTPMSGMNDDDDDEGDEGNDSAVALPTDKEATKKGASLAHHKREDKAAKLRKMMEDEDDDTVSPVEDAAYLRKDDVAQKGDAEDEPKPS